MVSSNVAQNAWPASKPTTSHEVTELVDGSYSTCNMPVDRSARIA
jgi:hypothetical protein